jgi:hypothetical protein
MPANPWENKEGHNKKKDRVNSKLFFIVVCLGKK